MPLSTERDQMHQNSLTFENVGVIDRLKDRNRRGDGLN